MCKYCEIEKWLSEYNNGFGTFIAESKIIIVHTNLYDEIPISYCPICRKEAGRVKKCKHKCAHESRNEEIGGYNIPEGVTTEYDIYCSKCGEYLGHWAYGSTDIEYHLNYELNWWKRILAKLHIQITDAKLKIKYKKYDDNGDLPF